MTCVHCVGKIIPDSTVYMEVDIGNRSGNPVQAKNEYSQMQNINRIEPQKFAALSFSLLNFVLLRGVRMYGLSDSCTTEYKLIV